MVKARKTDGGLVGLDVPLSKEARDVGRVMGSFNLHQQQQYGR